MFKFWFLCIFFPISLLAQQTPGILTEAEIMPYFPGCEEFKENSEEKRQCSNMALVAYISQNIRYPETARENNIEGTVYASFVVNKRGKVSNPVVLRDIGGGCAGAAIRVIDNMPTWEPAFNNGEHVAVKLSIPIQFYMEDEEPDLSENYKINWGNLKGKKVSKEKLIENLKKEVIVRDQYGEDVSISVLHFAYKRKRTFLEAKSTGRITESMKKVVQKIKRGGDFAVKATIQDNGEMIDVMKVFTLVAIDK